MATPPTARQYTARQHVRTSKPPTGGGNAPVDNGVTSTHLPPPTHSRDPHVAQHLIAAVEAGGTKFRAGIFTPDAFAGPEAADPIDEIRVETTTPDETLAAVGDFLTGHKVEALGIASFGPLVVDHSSPNYGAIATTPKPGWTGVPILATLSERLGVPGEIQTDVEAAAVAEQRLGAGRGYDSVAYITVGTGVGVGVVLQDGKPFRGRDHIELGHMPVERHPEDTFVGTCPFHGDCLEGLACGPALIERWQTRPSTLPEDHIAWDIEADYLAQLACVITWALSPDRILFSGGVGARPHLGPKIAAATKRRLAGYSVSHADNDDLVATAGLGNDAGLVGAGLIGVSILGSSIA